MRLANQKQVGPRPAKPATGAGAPQMEVRWCRVPKVTRRTLAVLDPEYKLELLPDEIGTREAAEILHCSIRSVQAMCDEGRLMEGRDWRKLRCHGGRGKYLITREAVLRLRTKEGKDDN